MLLMGNRGCNAYGEPVVADAPPVTLPSRPPTPEDCLRVFYTLTHHIRPRLPPELGLLILKNADYVPRIETSARFKTTVSAHSGGGLNSKVVLLTPPLLAGRIAKLRFWIKACDQGWSGEPDHLRGTFTSWTWFDAGILRPIPPISPPEPPLPEGTSICDVEATQENDDKKPAPGVDFIPMQIVWERDLEATGSVNTDFDGFPGPGWKSVGVLYPNGNSIPLKRVYRNINTSSTPREQIVEWGPGLFTGKNEYPNPITEECNGEGFVSTLQEGDRVYLIASAIYPGWSNNTSGAQIQVFYSL